MNNADMFASCMVSIAHLRDIAVNLAKNDGMSEEDAIKICVGAVINGMDASLFDLVDTAMDSDIDRIVRKATKNKRS